MVIQSSVELLKQKNFDQSAKQHIREIEVTVKNANAIVNRLVMWNRQQPENEQLVCLAKSVEEAVVLIDALMPTGVTTNYDLPNYPCPINISPGQLNQILLNLCSNAEYAMREAGGRLSIGVNMDSDKRWVTLTVGDSGPGIAEELKQRIFSPFYSTKPNGSGIGLSMVNAIVQNVGGKITIADRIGGG
jgi:signal transduction histidine kinase